MSFTGLLSRTGSIHPYAASTKDNRGNTKTSYGTAVPTAYYMEQKSADEQLVGRDTRITTWLLVVPASSGLTARDRFEDEDGFLYDVEGDPAKIWNPRTREFHHIEATLRRVTG